MPHLLWHGTSVFSGLIRRTAPFSRLLQYAWGCGGSILIQILTGYMILTCVKKIQSVRCSFRKVWQITKLNHPKFTKQTLSPIQRFWLITCTLTSIFKRVRRVKMTFVS
jgi:hypothetical protein